MHPRITNKIKKLINQHYVSIVDAMHPQPSMTDILTTQPLDHLSKEIVTHLVEDLLYSISDSCPSVVNIIHDYTDFFHPQRYFSNIVLQDLLRVTHCHGCGYKKNVSLLGYVGMYCGKRCYNKEEIYTDDYEYDPETGQTTYILNENRYYDFDSPDYDEEDNDRLPHSATPCDWCNDDIQRVSTANSKYHHVWRSIQSPNGYYWPMLPCHIPCYNECIRDRPTIRIPRYNY